MDLYELKKGDPDYHVPINDNFSKLGASIAALIDVFYPVGSIYQSEKADDPASFMGGTWTRIKGRVLVGVDESDSDFVANKTGGSKTHTHDLDAYAQMQISATYLGAKTRSGTYTANVKASSFTGVADTAAKDQGVNISGKATSASSLQPYQTVYIWKRTA
ncbi:phage baseplate protein [Enterococcus sp. LJL128]